MAQQGGSIIQYVTGWSCVVFKHPFLVNNHLQQAQQPIWVCLKMGICPQTGLVCHRANNDEP